MKTVVLEKPGRFVGAETDDPGAPGAGEALVRVRAVGICGTDVHAYHGDQPFFEYPRILGHELAVEVVEVGEPTGGVAVGDRCAVEPYLTCGECRPCRAGRTNCCETLRCLGVHVDGGMRERIRVPVAKLHGSTVLDDDQLALVEMLGIGKHAVDRAQTAEADLAAVIGLGPIGLAASAFAQLAGTQVRGVEVSEARARRAEALLGIETLVVDPTRPAAEQWDQRIGERPTVVFEATGSRASMQRSFELPGHGGRLVLIGLTRGEVAFDDPSFHRRELAVLSSRNSTGRDFRQIISLMESGRLDVRPWVTHRAPITELPDRFESWLKPQAGLLKAVVRF